MVSFLNRCVTLEMSPLVFTTGRDYTLTGERQEWA